MLMLISFVLLGIFVYVNTLFYSISLLLFVLGLLFTLVSNIMIHSLTILLLVIVYVGAMIILIGYICAICPNLILVPNHLSVSFYILYSLLFFLVFFWLATPSSVDMFIPLSNYFYSWYGGLAFAVLVFILFLTLLIVTSQYITPNGPFRSVSI